MSQGSLGPKTKTQHQIAPGFSPDYGVRTRLRTDLSDYSFFFFAHPPKPRWSCCRRQRLSRCRSTPKQCGLMSLSFRSVQKGRSEEGRSQNCRIRQFGVAQVRKGAVLFAKERPSSCFQLEVSFEEVVAGNVESGHTALRICEDRYFQVETSEASDISFDRVEDFMAKSGSCRALEPGCERCSQYKQSPWQRWHHHLHQ